MGDKTILYPHPQNVDLEDIMDKEEGEICNNRTGCFVFISME